MLSRVGDCISDARPFAVNCTSYRSGPGFTQIPTPPVQGRPRFAEWFQHIARRAPRPLRNGCRGWPHSANLERLCQVLEVLRVGLQKETGLVPHEEATQHRPLTTLPDARHDLCFEAINDRLVDIVQCRGLAFHIEVVAVETAQGVAAHVVVQALHGFDNDSSVFGEHTMDLGLKRLRRLTHAKKCLLDHPQPVM